MSSVFLSQLGFLIKWIFWIGVGGLALISIISLLKNTNEERVKDKKRILKKLFEGVKSKD